MLKLDLHLHTCYSDGDRVSEIVRMAKFKGLNGFAVTDHDTLRGYKAIKSIDDSLLVLPGLEIETNVAHLLLLGIKECPPRRIWKYEEVIEWARDNNAVVIMAHPIATFLSIKRNMRLVYKHRPDALETHNSLYPLFSLTKRLSVRMAESLSLPMSGGSDAHRARDVGNCYTLVDAEPSLDDILESIRKGKIKPEGKPSNMAYRVEVGFYFIYSLFENICFRKK